MMTSSRHAPRRFSVAFVTVGASLVSACGPKAENSSDFPAKPNAITVENLDPTIKAAAARWDDLSTTLGLASINAADPNSLSPQSTTKLADLNTPIGLMLREYGPRLNEGRCATIESMTEVAGAKSASNADLPAKVYLMAFKRKKADGTPSDEVNYGLVTTPDSPASQEAQKAPLVVFGHPMHASLEYAHVAGLLDQLQAGAIVLAPAFAGEKITLGGTEIPGLTVGAQDLSKRFAGDADIMLGMLDCVTTAIVTAAAPTHPTQVDVTRASGTSSEKTGAHFAARFKMLNAAAYQMDTTQNASMGLPRTIFAGADFGGLTANLALAKAGTAWGLFNLRSQDENHPALGAAVKGAKDLWAALKYDGTEIKPTVGCAATLAAPASAAHGEYRLGLRFSVNGILSRTPFAASPFAQVMDQVLTPYRNGSRDAATAATEIMKRDALFNAPLSILALRDWNTAMQDAASRAAGGPGVTVKAGRMFFAHSLSDQVVFTNQTAMMSGVVKAASDQLSAPELSLAPGVKTVALAVTPKSGVTDPASIHLLAGFSEGKPLTAAASATQASFVTTDESWASVESGALTSPATAFATWYQGVCLQ